MNKNILIEIKDLKKSFKSSKGNLKEVHKGINLNIYDNERLAIIGSNGAGKTVLVETIVGIIKQDEGTIKYNFETKDFYDEIGIQFQTIDESNSLLRPKDLIYFYRKLYLKEKINEEYLEKLIETFGIKEYYNKKINSLSGGQKQRVNLLLAMIHQPKLLILDEFTTGLDILAVIDILEHVEKTTKENKSSMIIISHNPKEIKDLSDRIVLIKNGVIEKEFITSEVNKKYKGNFEDFLIENLRSYNV